MCTPCLCACMAKNAHHVKQVIVVRIMYTFVAIDHNINNGIWASVYGSLEV